jgi:hypothetical protein
MAIQSTIRHRFYKNDGTLNAGGKVYTYLPNTTTLTTTYTDANAGTPNANPIILDAKGEAAIWQTAKIKINVLESDDTQVTGYPVDYIGYLIIADDIHEATNKSVPIDADELGMWDSVSQLLRKVTFAQLWTWIQSKLAAPGAIGGTTPAAVSSSSGALNGTLGATTPNTIAATTINASGLITATGGQVKFPATQVPSSDVNTLDDYEEGTWTPSLGGTTTYTTQVGTYVKIGKCVFYDFTLTVNVLGTGNVNTISGLPFTSGNSLASCPAAAYWSNIAVSVTTLHTIVIGSSTTMQTFGVTAAGVTSGVQNVFGNSAMVKSSGVYFV